MKTPTEAVPRTGGAGQPASSAHPALKEHPDYTFLLERVSKAIAEARRRGLSLAVVCLDLDGLIEINDLHGESVGEHVLEEVGSALVRNLRKGDSLIKIGGDEFIALLLDLPDPTACRHVLNRLLQAVSKPVPVGEYIFQLSACAGLTIYRPEMVTDANQLLRQARKALRQAGADSRNRIQFYEPDRASFAIARCNPERIHQGITAGEFVIYYQPKVNMSSGAIIGAEGLIRWNHPERGFLPPAAFLPVIAHHPVSVELGQWVIDTALDQLDCWQEAGLEIPISVNVSRRQLQQPDFLDRLASQLAAHPRLKPFSLELEILETSALEDVSLLSKLLEACGDLGVSIALDNFGNGNSSLNDLKRLHANLLKIDPCFVRDIIRSQEDLDFLQGVLGLAHAFRREAIAEGIETIEHGVMLLRLGCELGQGYAISVPMPAEDFPSWAASWRPDPRWSRALATSEDDRLLLDAADEHRAWVHSIEEFLSSGGVDENGNILAEPRQSRHQCKLGKWLDANGQTSSQPALQALVAAHWRIHALGTGLLKFHAQGQSAEGLARIGELRTALDKLLENLEACR